ncbi:MAG: DUF952 domain-containing protein [bacterium]|nr:DUF952 domain-containing protein [bacterium]
MKKNIFGVLFITATITTVFILLYFNRPPAYLYKVLSVECWEQSKNYDKIILPEMDREFIHFSTKQQLNNIIEKFWKGVPTFMLLTVETKKLPGRLMYESNPGGTNKYYHLYDGSIPHEAIVETKIIEQ